VRARAGKGLVVCIFMYISFLSVEGGMVVGGSYWFGGELYSRGIVGIGK
jgi:hypothetical protein